MRLFISTIFMGLLFGGHLLAAQDFSSTLLAAHRGDVQAMLEVGMAYYNGDKTLKDPFKAKCWVQKAYQEGSVQAKEVWETLKLWQYSGKCDLSFDDELLSKYHSGDVFIEPLTRMRFIYISKGCFQMGCGSKKCSKNETPRHRVCLDGFWIGAHEVTQGVWQSVMGQNPSRFRSGFDYPVENVSYDDIEMFVRKLNSISRETLALPTEAQWEYACTNGGRHEDYPWKGADSRPRANCGNCNNRGFNGQTAPVGSFDPNGLGVYDMGGNVKEWCKDVYDKNAYVVHSKTNPEYKEKGALRVVRGGSYTDISKKLRCTARDKSIPSIKMDNIGFRLVLVRSTQ